MSRLLKLMLLIGASGLHGANLVDNGTLESDQSTSPDNWVVSGKAFEYHRTGGPGGKAMITVKNADSFSL
ncbi:MAG: hypothetical protein PHN98_07385, partial [Smithellaceae bacterium]|nr:hypothetical protein [Smithellaceae bacterium]